LSALSKLSDGSRKSARASVTRCIQLMQLSSCPVDKLMKLRRAGSHSPGWMLLPLLPDRQKRGPLRVLCIRLYTPGVGRVACFCRVTGAVPSARPPSTAPYMPAAVCDRLGCVWTETLRRRQPRRLTRFRPTSEI